jgi:ABC-2 type transport system permease protein
LLPSALKTAIYISIDKDVSDIRIDLYPGAGRALKLSSLEINPTRLNCNWVMLVLSFIFPLLIGVSLVSIFFDRGSLKKDIFAMKRYKYLLYDLVVKDVKTKYRRSVLGILWSVLNPLLMMCVLTLIFSNIIRVEVEGGFALFYLTGYLVFNFISEATSFSLHSVIDAAPLIKKVYIPKYIFPLQKCIFSLVNMLFSLVAFVIVFVIFCITDKVSPHFTMLMFPLPMIYVFVFCLGLCLILSALVVFFRDIGHIWGILLTVWMYASPIIYPITILPGWLRSVLRLNPLTHYIDYFRNVMIYGKVPTLGENVICILSSLSVFLIGVVIFRKKQDKFLMHI